LVYIISLVRPKRARTSDRRGYEDKKDLGYKKYGAPKSAGTPGLKEQNQRERKE